MRTWRLPLSLAVLETLVLLSSIAVTHPAMAQVVDCVSCVGTDVTPDGGNVTVSANSTQNNLTFTVTNTGTLSGTFTFTCSATGNVTCGTVTPASKVIGPGFDAIVNVKFDAGAVGTGVITLTASGGTTDTGFYNITVQATGPPVVVLRNHNKDNVERINGSEIRFAYSSLNKLLVRTGCATTWNWAGALGYL